MIEKTDEAGSSDAKDSRATRPPGPVFRLRIPLLLAFSLLLAASLALSFFYPRQYRSRLEIEVRAAGAPGDSSADDRTQTELALARSEEVASAVADPAWSSTPSVYRTPERTARHQAAVAAFERQLSVQADPGSNLLRIALTASDPHTAADLAARFLDVFLASQRNTSDAARVTSFFVEDAAQTRAAFEEASSNLEQYRLAHPAPDSSRFSALSGQIDALTQQMRDTGARIAARGAEVLEGERHLIAVAARRKTPPEAGSVLTTPQLNTMLAIDTDQRAVMMTRDIPAGLRDAAVAGLTRQIDATTSALAIAQRPGAIEPAFGPEWRETNDRIASASAELHRLHAERDQQTERLATLRQALAAVERPEPSLVLLQLKADAAHTSWQLAEQRSSEARIVEAIEQQSQGNVSVLLPPSFADTAAISGPWLLILPILAGVLLAGLAVVIYLQRPGNPGEEDEAPEPATTSPFRDAASNLLRAAASDPGPPPGLFEPPPAADVPEAQWQALASILLEDQPAPANGAPPAAPQTSTPPDRALTPAPNFVFETTQSTVTTSSLSFSTAANTVVPARSLRPDPPPPEPPPMPEPQPARPAVEVRTEPLPEPPGPFVEVRTGPLPPVFQPEPDLPPPPVPEPEPVPVTEIQPPPARLTPYQRMKRRRAVPTLDKNGRVTYLTYTFDPEPPRDAE